MLVLRLLVMVLTIICLMDGHAEVLSSTTAMRNGGESSSLKQNEPEVQILDRKKKKKPKPGKKKKPKPNKKKKPKPNKAKPTPTKPVTTTPTISTSTLKTTTITTTARTTTITVSPTTTATTAKTTTSTASATTTLSTTTSATTAKTTAATSTATTTTTTISTTATTSSPATTAATTADSGAGGECKATNGRPCIFPFKDGNEEYNECKNEGGKYFWCATSVYDSGKYKHWSYCPNDGSCPIPGDEECRATNNKPCVFPFKDGNKEYNECADYGGKYFWCATGTNSAGKYTAWSECPKDGSCPLPPKSTPPGATSTLTIATTTLPNTASSTPATTVSPQESASTTVLVKDGEKIFSCQMDFTFESTAGFKMNSNFSASCSPSSSATKHYKNFDEYAFDITTSSGAEINCKINIVIQDETSGISMAAKPMEKSLDCSVDESKCVTISGEHFPTTCVVPFIHEGRKYQACTDKGGKDAGKLWCATAVDDNEEMIKWGYCSTACGYCGGKDVTDQDTRAGGACGYDCFINPYKPMEPKTQGIDPRLLSAPEVSYYDDEMTVWNKLPNIQFQFLQGQPGIFLNCLDGFNHFPCHQSIYIKCDGHYRFSIYAADLKDDNTATIGEFIQNDVKNVQIGCGPCPMGFIYKVGDEVSTYLTSWGKYSGVPDIAACKDICNQRDCPTFVYSSEDKYCELHSVRIENPSNPVFKDYRLCTREEENSCGEEEKLTLVCPDEYLEKSNAPSLYLLNDWIYSEYANNVYESADLCATECELSAKCNAVVSTICKGCQLLTNQEDFALYPHKEASNYCLRGQNRGLPYFTRVAIILDCPFPRYKKEDRAVTNLDNGLTNYDPNTWQDDRGKDCLDKCANDANCKGYQYSEDTIENIKKYTCQLVRTRMTGTPVKICLKELHGIPGEQTGGKPGGQPGGVAGGRPAPQLGGCVAAANPQVDCDFNNFKKEFFLKHVCEDCNNEQDAWKFSVERNWEDFPATTMNVVIRQPKDTIFKPYKVGVIEQRVCESTFDAPIYFCFGIPIKPTAEDVIYPTEEGKGCSYVWRKKCIYNPSGHLHMDHCTGSSGGSWQSRK